MPSNHTLSFQIPKGQKMNNQQLIKVFPIHPKRSIHRVPPGAAYNRWLTFTAQVPNLGGRSWVTLREQLLDALYEDWQQYRDQAIEMNL